MGATGTPTQAGSTRTGQMAYQGGAAAVLVPVTFTMSASYSTDGDTLTLPAADMVGFELQEVVLLTPHDGTRTYAWDGSKTAPKIKAFTAFATQAAAAADLSAVTLRALLIYDR